MKYDKLRKRMATVLQIVAVILIATIFILVCIPTVSKIEKEVPTTVQAEETQTEPELPKEEKSNQKYLALTFDDGPTPTVTNRILDTLEKYHAKATFFVVGRQVKQANSLVKRAVDIGCEIGNHTWEHKAMAVYKSDDLKKSLQKTSSVVNRYTDFSIQLVRPTYGSVNKKVRKTVGSPLIYWNVDTVDWESRDVKKIMNKVKGNKVTDGDIVLMHDLHPETADAVEKMVPYLQKQGYELVTVSELMERKGIQMAPGTIYYSSREHK